MGPSTCRAPNKRLKLAGGDRSKGIGVLCPWRGTDCRPLLLRRRAGRPQLKRDPLGSRASAVTIHIRRHRGILLQPTPPRDLVIGSLQGTLDGAYPEGHGRRPRAARSVPPGRALAWRAYSGGWPCEGDQGFYPAFVRRRRDQHVGGGRGGWGLARRGSPHITSGLRSADGGRTRRLV